MDIKQELKKHDVKISKIASELHVSRPTLDYYIKCYEQGVKLPNDHYQKIFDYLFSNQSKSTIEFITKFEQVKDKPIDQEEKRPIYVDPEDNIRTGIIRKIEDYSVDWRLLNFIKLLINNDNNELVKGLYRYFAFTNGWSDVACETISEKDKALFSHLSRTFQEYRNGKIEIDSSQLLKFKLESQTTFSRKNSELNEKDVTHIKNMPEPPKQ